MRVLDLGCGPGFITRELYHFMEGNGHVTGVDVEPALLDVVGRTALEPGLRFLNANAYDLPFADQEFDFAYARLVLQHLSDPEAALCSLYRVLGAGGTICITDVDDRWVSVFPDDSGLRSLFDRATRAQNDAGGDRYIGAKLAHLLERTGFVAVRPEVTPLANHNVGRRALFDILWRGRIEYLPVEERAEANAELEAAWVRLEAQSAWIQCGIFTVTACKPELACR
jgi:SAM-dependent methyltransferase